MAGGNFEKLKETVAKELVSDQRRCEALVHIACEACGLQSSLIELRTPGQALMFLERLEKDGYFSPSCVVGLMADSLEADFLSIHVLLREYECSLSQPETNVPASLFVGRSSEMEALSDLIFAPRLPEGGLQRILIFGEKGIGKTEFVLRFCEKFASRISTLRYVEGSTLASVEKSLIDFRSQLRALNAVSENESDFSSLGTALSTRRWILVIDSVQHEIDVAAIRPDLQGEGAIILITDAPIHADGWISLLIPPFNPDFTQEFIRNTVNDALEGDIRILHDLFRGNPFALGVASQFLVEEGISLKKLVRGLSCPKEGDIERLFVTKTKNIHRRATIAELYSDLIKNLRDFGRSWDFAMKIALLCPRAPVRIVILEALALGDFESVARSLLEQGVIFREDDRASVNVLFSYAVMAEMDESSVHDVADSIIEILDGLWCFEANSEETWGISESIGTLLLGISQRLFVSGASKVNILVDLLLEYGRFLKEARGDGDAADLLTSDIRALLESGDGDEDGMIVKGEEDPQDEEVDALIAGAEQNIAAFDSYYSSKGMKAIALRSDDLNCGYVGISNQGATCYLNSLLQVLLQCPRFLHLLYKISEEKLSSNELKVDSIPYQLALLFARMERGVKSVQRTTALTQSFGWKYEDVVQQHDILELFNLLLEALDDVDFHVSRLFEGVTVDVIRCSECKRLKEGRTPFQVLSLRIADVKTVEEALTKYFAKVEFKGDDKYFCSSCDKKVKAAKFTAVESFPELLVLHLQRFDFDLRSMERRKLNKVVKFPFALEMDSFRHQEISGSDESAHFDLFAVIVHTGVAAGGHYYAYIYIFNEEKWLCFNDTSIEYVDAERVLTAFGGEDKSGDRGALASTANAYILIYASDTVKKSFFESNAKQEIYIPGAILDVVNEENSGLRVEDEEAKHFRDKYKLTFVYKNEKKAVLVPKSMVFSTLVRVVYKMFDIKKEELPMDYFILHPYLYASVSLLEFETDYQSIKDNTLVELKFLQNITLLVENRDLKAVIAKRVAGTGLMRLFIYTYNNKKKIFNVPHDIEVHFSDSVNRVITFIAGELKIPAAKVRIFNMTREANEINRGGLTLSEVGVRDGSRLLLENTKTQANLFHDDPTDDTVVRTGILKEKILEYFRILQHEMRMLLKLSDEIADAVSSENLEEGGELELFVDSRISIKEFREKIESSLIWKDKVDFKIMKGVNADIELKELGSTLQELHIGRFTSITLVSGTPLDPNQATVVFLKLEEGFPEFHRARFFGCDKIKKLRSSVAGCLQIEDVGRIRIREKRGDKVKSVFRDYQTVEEAFGYVSDILNVAVSILEKPESLKKKSSLFSYQKYSRKEPEGSRFSMRCDHLCGNEDASINAILEVLSEMKIPEQKALVAKVFLSNIFADPEKTILVHKETFHTISEIREAQKLIYSSIGHLHDGDLLIIKDLREDEGEISKQKKIDNQSKTAIRKQNQGKEKSSFIGRLLGRRGDPYRRGAEEDQIGDGNESGDPTKRNNRRPEVAMKIYKTTEERS